MVFETLLHLIRHQVTPYYAKNSKINFTFFTKFLYHRHCASFLGVENCSPANVIVALVDFTRGVSFTLKHLKWVLKQSCDSFTGHVLKHANDVCLQKRILAWMKAYELRIAVVKNYSKNIRLLSLDDLFLHLLWWNPCVLLPKLCCYFAFSAKMKMFLTDGQPLLRISIASWASLASLKIA